MSVAAALELALHREQLLAHVTALTEPDRVPTPDGSRAEVPPLLEQAGDARLDGSRIGFGTGLARSSAPCRLTATTLLMEVDRWTGCRPGADRLAATRSWAARVGGSPVLGEVADAAQVAGGWVAAARTLLSSTRSRIALRGARCPSCGARDVVAPGPAGEDVVEPALGVHVDTGTATCSAAECGSWWSAELLPVLAAVLEQQDAEVLAVE